MNNAYDYSQYNSFNRFENLDGIETKIVNHLIALARLLNKEDLYFRRILL